MYCRRPLLLLVAVASFTAAGCQKFVIERHGRPCGGLGDCIDGFTCDERSDTCIATGDPCDLEGLVSPCELGAGTCVDGCRWCENDAWTQCRPGVGEECEPGVTLCGADTLVVCNLNGFIAEETDCGEPGCNRDVWPPRCNECLPSQTSCIGLLLADCDDGGFIIDSEDCDTGVRCAGAGTCDPVAGCGVAASVPDGTPCDTGDGDDGDYCNSSCVNNECQGNVDPTCVDTRECTDDTCNSTTGCVFVPHLINSACEGNTPDLCDSSCNGAGQCRDGVPVRCDDGNLCSVDTCEPSGQCSSAPAVAGAICRAAVDDCDAAETCDGVAVDCPVDLPVAAGIFCGDGAMTECTQPDQCDGAGLCLDNHQPAESVCGNNDDCDFGDRCDGQGSCIDNGALAVDIPCGDPSASVCDNADSCDGVGSCRTNAVASGTRCGNQGECDVGDTCDGAGSCTDNGFRSSGAACGSATDTECDNSDTCSSGGICLQNYELFGFACGAQGECDAGDFCDGAGTCDPKGFALAGSACGDSLTDSVCTDPDTCDAGGVCQANDVPDGTGCACVSSPCEGCFGGQCYSCDGGPTARSCTQDSDCSNCPTGECERRVCFQLEHQACANASGTGWGDGFPCEDVTCAGNDSTTVDDAIGSECSGDNTSMTMTYVFNTASPAMPFNIWMRNAADQNTSPSERYYCSVTNTAVGTAYFEYVEADATERYGPRCIGVGNTSTFCWMAADFDTEAANRYQPVILNPGEHTLVCVAATSSSSAEIGFDGFIFTNDLSFVPDKMTSCSTNAAFDAGTCANWGPNATPAAGGGRCSVEPDTAVSCSSCGNLPACFCNNAGNCIYD